MFIDCPPPLECKSHKGGGLGLQCSIIKAAAAKSLQLCPTLCDPIDGSPSGSSVPGILRARILEWAAISFFIISMINTKKPLTVLGTELVCNANLWISECRCSISVSWFFPFFAYLFIYLVVPGLTCGMENLFSCSTWDLVSQPEVKPGPLQWECRVSATGWPGSSLIFFFFGSKTLSYWEEHLICIPQLKVFSFTQLLLKKG